MRELQTPMPTQRPLRLLMLPREIQLLPPMAHLQQTTRLLLAKRSQRLMSNQRTGSRKQMDKHRVREKPSQKTPRQVEVNSLLLTNPMKSPKLRPTRNQQKIMAFIKKHWKTILMILIICVAIAFGGWFLAGKIAASKVATTAISSFMKTTSQFRLPAGMTTLPEGATLIGNGVVKYADGSVLASGDTIDVDDIDF